ncbi:glycosyltransferase [Intrasporangium flavum]|uniref:glycosyltransferase n=1 Tax=Intrasporangium flavum TaxID=1428657 RepID=UPI00096BDE4A|nr:glycosyltransferase [Intrasporangium flavum]
MADGRVLWLHSHFELPTGGTKYIYEVARRLAEVRPVEMVVESASPLWRDRYAAEGITLNEIGGLTSTRLAYWAAFPWFLRRDLKALRSLVRPGDVLVSSFYPMPWAATRVARDLGLRHVSLCFEPFPFFHDAEVIGLYPRPKRALLRGLRMAYGRLDHVGITAADSLLTLNATTKGEIERVYGRGDAVPVYAGVDTELFRPYSDEEVAHLVAAWGPGPWVVHSTDFSPIKRTDLAVLAFAEAARSNPEARLLVTSTREDPAAEAQVRRLAAEHGVGDRVVMAGFLPFADLPRAYSLATALLQTGTSAGSGATTMSLPVKEALACGTAVVRSRATDEDVEDGVSGFLVDPSDSAQTGARLSELLGDPARASKMGLAGRERIETTYTWSKVVDSVSQEVNS